MIPAGPLRTAFRLQARHCRRLGSPFTAALCEALPEVLDAETAAGARVTGWDLDPVESALALRLCGALHRAVRAGMVPELAAHYPPDGDGALQGEVLRRALRALPAGWLDSAPQTNEVARSGVLLGGLLTLAAETGLPLELLEIGSSAGLNLHPDCYFYNIGCGRHWGAVGPVGIDCDWRGALPPLDAPLKVAARAGSDIAPVDPGDPAARARMLGYIWPDQPARLARAGAALDHAAAHAATVEKAEAADWVEARLARPAAGRTRVLMHSIVWQYLPKATQGRIAAAMARAGAAAGADSPLAWLRLEPDGDTQTAAVLLTLWPGGDTRVIGRGDWHGRFAEWGQA